MSTIIRSIDTGYGHTKYITDTNGSSITCNMMPSLVAPASQLQLSTGLMDHRDTRNVIVNDASYVVGPDVDTMISRDHSHPLHNDYSNTEKYIALHYGALSYMNIPRIDLLVLGLPVHLLNSRSQSLKEKFQGTIILNQDKTIEINKVSIVAQPMGGYVYFTKQNSLSSSPAFKEMKTLIIDPGYYTFDWLVAKGYMPLDQKSGAHEGGMFAILKRIAEEISQDKTVNKQELPYNDYHNIDLALRKGTLNLYGQQIDINRYLGEANKYTKNVFDILLNTAGHGSDIENVVLVGGAAPYFIQAAEHYFPSHRITIVDESIYANVRGFQLLGQAYYDTLKQEVA